MPCDRLSKQGLSRPLHHLRPASRFSSSMSARVPALHIFFLHHKSCELGDLRAAKSARTISADEAERGSRLSGPQLWRDAKNSEREAGGRQLNPELFCFGSCSISDASRRRTTKTQNTQEQSDAELYLHTTQVVLFGSLGVTTAYSDARQIKMLATHKVERYPKHAAKSGSQHLEALKHRIQRNKVPHPLDRFSKFASSATTMVAIPNDPSWDSSRQDLSDDACFGFLSFCCRVT